MFPGFAAQEYVSLGKPAKAISQTACGFESHMRSLNNTKVYSKHVLKFGYEMRLLRVNTLQTFEPVGSFSFTKALTQGPNPNAATAIAGDGGGVAARWARRGNDPIQEGATSEHGITRSILPTNGKSA